MSTRGLISTIPSAVKEILTSTGYNSALSILQIDEHKMNEIELFAEENSRHIIDSFKEYSNKKPFAFLPGHRECIFGIKSEILNQQNKKKPKTSDNRNTLIDDDNLQASLESQISNFAKKIGLSNVDWADSITNFKSTNLEFVVSANCSVACPKCDSIIGVSYDRHWKVSNLFKHLRKHINKNAETSTNILHETIYVDVVNADDASKD